MLSTVIPVYNEDESLRALHAELSEVAAAQGIELDIIFIDDGSKDDSWRVINELAERDPRVRGIRFRTNFGKAAALSAGFKLARGELVMTLDADLQDDPHEIPRFLEKIHGGLDVVSGYKQVRHDPWHKVYPSRVFNWLVSWMTGVKLHDHNCGMKCYRREIFDEVRLYGELHRFVPVLAAARGYKIGELVINHRARKFGHSKYGVRRFVKGFLDLLTVKFLTNFGQRPQHLLGTIGLLSFAGGLLGMFYLAAVWVFQYFFPEGATPLHQRPALLYSACAFLFGGQILSIGLLAEMLTAYYGRDSDVYSIAASTDSTLATPANDTNRTAASANAVSPNDPAL
jgi:dolichol-phosphate mannosyltransferase